MENRIKVRGEWFTPVPENQQGDLYYQGQWYTLEQGTPLLDIAQALARPVLSSLYQGVILKYDWPRDHGPLYLPFGAHILHVNQQARIMKVWAMVDSEETALIPHNILIVGTGDIHDFPNYVYLNTFFVPEAGLVYHAIEVFP